MKTSNRSKFHKGGYAALLSVVSLSLTIMAFAITSFRETRQSHAVQARNQVKLDYSQKERALLRALLDIVPNTAMRAMAKDSFTRPAAVQWPAVFKAALKQANIEQSIDPAVAAKLGISVKVTSSNTSNGAIDHQKLIIAPDGSGNDVMRDSQGSRPPGLTLPPRLKFFNGDGARSINTPIINFGKRFSKSSSLYTKMPYPEIAFGYSAQGKNFIAKRNWWAFTVNFGIESAAITGIAPSPRTYVLSIYEVPTQLAISSSGATTSLGKHKGGTSWDTGNAGKISITGSIYAKNALVEDTSRVGSIASRDGITLGTNAPSGQSIGGTAARREMRATTTTDAFYPYTSSSDSGLVSFTPVNRGSEFFDYFADTTPPERSTSHFTEDHSKTAHKDYLSYEVPQNTANKRTWSEYSIGARQTQIQVEVGGTSSTAFQRPTRLFITARFGGDKESRRQRASQGNWWRGGSQGIGTSATTQSWPYSPKASDWFIQSSTLQIDGRPVLELDLEKLPKFLSLITADDVTVNNSIWIGPNPGTGNVTAAGTSTSDTALVIQKSTDLSAFTKGLTIITPYRVYFADNFNTVPVATPPPGAPTPWFPPVSIYAPDKRFGTGSVAGKIRVEGQIGHLPDSTNSATVNPLDLKNGATDNANPSSISASLRGVTEARDLPPINAMSWLTVIEEIR